MAAPAPCASPAAPCAASASAIVYGSGSVGPSGEPLTGFEGCEKKLELDFRLSGGEKKSSLRLIPRAVIDDFLTEARCTIISHTGNDFFDAYVLSESSLFVYPSKIILKTCGTTRLLHALPKIIRAAAEFGAEVDFVQFSRSNFIFPHAQPYPHRNFTMEVQYLNSVFERGHAHILGPLNGPRWHLYTSDLERLPCGDDQTLEVVMFNLDRRVMRKFYKRVALEEPEDALAAADAKHAQGAQGPPAPASEGDELQPSTGKEATQLSGIDKLIPGAVIDDFLFSPCGYSCNGLKDGAYFTIHITPEPHCSFVSFETNLRVPNYGELVERVIKTFKPGHFCVSLFMDKNAVAAPSQTESLGWQFDGYTRKGHTYHTFEADYNVSCGHYTSNEAAHPAAAPVTAAVEARPIPASAPAASAAQALDEDASGTISVSLDVARKLEQQHMIGVAMAAVKKRVSVQNVDAAMAKHPEQLIHSIVEAEHPEEPFLLCDLGELVRRYRKWIRAFPRLEPAYYTKCNDSPGVLTALAALGCRFVCATMTEMKQVLALGVDAERIYFCNPWKPEAHVRFAHDKGLGLLSFDSVAELHKIAKCYPKARLLVRLGGSFLPRNNSAPDLSTPMLERRRVADAAAKGAFGKKAAVVAMMQQNSTGRRQGAVANQIPELLAEAKRLGVNVVGVNVSLGKACEDVDDFKRIMRVVRFVFDQSKRVLGKEMTVIDMGAILPPDSADFEDGEEDAAEEASAQSANAEAEKNSAANRADKRRQREAVTRLPRFVESELAHQFGPGVRVIARLSRYVVSHSNTLAVSVVARRAVHSTLSSPPSSGSASPSPLENIREECVDDLAVLDEDDDDAAHCAAAAALRGEDGVGRDADARQPDTYVYTISDGCYGSFAGVLTAGRTVKPRVVSATPVAKGDDTDPETAESEEEDARECLRGANDADAKEDAAGPRARPSALVMPSKIKAKAQPTFASVLLGPTGESVDTVAHATLPLLAVGDWLYFRRMGAFAAKASAVALGFGTPDVRYINSWNG